MSGDKKMRESEDGRGGENANRGGVRKGKKQKEEKRGTEENKKKNKPRDPARK